MHQYRTIAFTLLLVMEISMTLYGKEPSLQFQPVDNFNLEKYLGTWYEIVRYPHSFEKGLTSVTATYTKTGDGIVAVDNAGYKNGKKSTARGKAKFAGDPSKGHLKVSFFWIFYADYIIVDLAEDYSWAIVTSTSSNYFWLLCRTPVMDDLLLENLLAKAKSLGFQREQMIFVEQKKTAQ